MKAPTSTADAAASPGRDAQDEEEAQRDFKDGKDNVNIVAQEEQNGGFREDQEDSISIRLDRKLAQAGNQEDHSQDDRCQDARQGYP